MPQTAPIANSFKNAWDEVQTHRAALDLDLYRPSSPESTPEAESGAAKPKKSTTSETPPSSEAGRGTKKCVKCKEVKPISRFGEHDTSKDGRQSYCKDCRNELQTIRRKRDPAFRLRHHIATRVSAQVIAIPAGYVANLEGYLGYKLADLVRHLEKDLQEREGPRRTLVQAFDDGYHVDHIEPLSGFGKVGIGSPEFRECWAMSNLRAIPAEENLAKGARKIA